jgi:RES domain-containing protein
MFADYPPSRANTLGARWNPPDVAAIYTSVAREAALAEADYHISLQPFRPRVKRTVYEIRVALANVVDLQSKELLAGLGVGEAELQSDDHSACRLVGGGVAWLGHDGLLVPSARHAMSNLVIFPTAQMPDAEFEVIGEEDVTDAGV